MLAGLPTSVASSPRFLAQLAEARRLRGDLCDDAAPAASSGALAAELALDAPEWAEATEVLRDALTAALSLERHGLERLHGALPRFSPREEAHGRVMEAKKRLLAPLAQLDRPATRQFLAAYHRVVCDVVAPHIAEAFEPGTMGSLHYAAFPTLRVQTPSLQRATIRPHFDGMYGLQAHPVNLWLPLTEVRPTSGLWCESRRADATRARGSGARPGAPADAGACDSNDSDDSAYDYHALTRATRFDGRNTIHFTVPNRSPRTRVSLDFRVVPGHAFDADERLSRLGYYARADAVRPGDARSEFVQAASGRVSVLHGMPHTAAAVELGPPQARSTPRRAKGPTRARATTG